MKCIIDLLKKKDEVSDAISEINNITQNKKEDRVDVREYLTGIVDLLLPHMFENNHTRNKHLKDIVDNLEQLVSSGKMHRDLELKDIQAEISKKLIRLKQKEIIEVKKESTKVAISFPDMPDILKDISFTFYSKYKYEFFLIKNNEDMNIDTFVNNIRLGVYNGIIDKYLIAFNNSGISDGKITFDNYTDFKKRSIAEGDYDVWFFLDHIALTLCALYEGHTHYTDNDISTKDAMVCDYIKLIYSEISTRLYRLDLSDIARLNLLYCLETIRNDRNHSGKDKILRSFIMFKDRDEIHNFYDKMVEFSNKFGLTYSQSFIRLLSNES